jgi:AI-2 transport protein TqsA
MPVTARADTGRALPLWLTVLLGVAAAAGALWGLHSGARILGPVVLAFVLTVVAHPMIGALQRHGAPRWLAVAAAVLTVDGGLILFTLAVIVSVGRLATVLPEYSAQWQKLLDGLRSSLAAVGVGPAQVQQALHSLQPQSVLAALSGLLSGVLGTLGALVLVLATALFMTAEGAGLPARLAAVPGTSPHLAAALAKFARGTRRYVVVTTVFGLLVAVGDTIALYLMGIPLALLWGLLSFLTNYIPNIGFVLGLLPPVLLGLLVGGPGLAVLILVVYSVINFVLQSILQPVFVGETVGMSVTLSFLSVIVWTVVLGPLGAVLAIPLTLFAIAVLVGQDPDRRWARTLLAGTSAPGRAEQSTGPSRVPRQRPIRRAPASRPGLRSTVVSSAAAPRRTGSGGSTAGTRQATPSSGRPPETMPPLPRSRQASDDSRYSDEGRAT